MDKKGLADLWKQFGVLSENLMDADASLIGEVRFPHLIV